MALTIRAHREPLETKGFDGFVEFQSLWLLAGFKESHYQQLLRSHTGANLRIMFILSEDLRNFEDYIFYFDIFYKEEKLDF